MSNSTHVQRIGTSRSKRIALIALAAMLGGCASKNEGSSHGHHQEAGDARPGHHMSMAGGKLMVQTDPAAVKAGQPTTLRLMSHDAGGVMIKDFEVVHEKKVHLIIVREELDQFAHIHPDEMDSAGNIIASFTFPSGGKYRLYADYKPVGKDPAAAMAGTSCTSCGNRSRIAKSRARRPPARSHLPMSLSNSSSVSTGTPSFFALSNLLPASAPATT